MDIILHVYALNICFMRVCVYVSVPLCVIYRRACVRETHTHRRVGVGARVPTSSVGPARLQAGGGDTVPRLGGEGEQGQAAGPVLRPADPTLLQARHDVPHRQTPGAVCWGPLKVKERRGGGARGTAGGRGRETRLMRGHSGPVVMRGRRSLWSVTTLRPNPISTPSPSPLF